MILKKSGQLVIKIENHKRMITPEALHVTLFSCTMVKTFWMKMFDLKLRDKFYFRSAWGETKNSFDQFSGIMYYCLYLKYNKWGKCIVLFAKFVFNKLY